MLVLRLPYTAFRALLPDTDATSTVSFDSVARKGSTSDTPLEFKCGARFSGRSKAVWQREFRIPLQSLTPP